MWSWITDVDDVFVDVNEIVELHVSLKIKKKWLSLLRSKPGAMAAAQFLLVTTVTAITRLLSLPRFANHTAMQVKRLPY